MASEPKYDRERDPAVIKKRTELFEQYVTPTTRFIDYLCVKYASDPKDIVEFKFRCMEHLYRTVELYDPSKYKDNDPARAWQNWCHIVCKRLIQHLEEERWKENSKGSDDVDADDIADMYDVCVDSSYKNVVITIDNYKSHMGDRFLYAFEHLDIIQKECFLLQHQGLSITEIHKDQVKRGHINPKTGNDSVKKRMQRGRVILLKYMEEYDQRRKEQERKQIEGNMPAPDPEDEFELKVCLPK